jgi:hypothetical protein
MELIKRDDRFDLYNEDGHKIASTLDGCVNKLSLKNCQAIENGYDLDELAIEYFKQIHMGFGIIEAYKVGFQKSIELNKNKLFTLEDMMNCWNKALTFQDHKELFGHHIQSLKQTEWEVEIEMDTINDGLDEMAQPQYAKIPKLDVDGCIILKRIKE